MLALYREYNVGHYRFPEHLRVAMIMTLVTPGCAVLFYSLIGWWNPWLWASCGVGFALFLALHSVVQLHKRPAGMTARAHRLVEQSENWFPLFFITIQSIIASLIVMFLWFSITALALDVPPYVHAVLVILCIMIPLRRLVWALLEKPGEGRIFVINEVIRAVWHILMSVFVARVILAVTMVDPTGAATDSLIWKTIVWVPALLYSLFTVGVTIEHIIHRKRPWAARQAPPQTIEEPMDRF
jgi:hypothetical protein